MDGHSCDVSPETQRALQAAESRLPLEKHRLLQHEPLFQFHPTATARNSKWVMVYNRGDP